MGIHDLGLFVAAGILLNITPGPDIALIVACSTRHGTRAGMAAALGVGAGAFVHIAATAVGLSALVLASATAFTALKWVGALYLVYIGLRMVWGARGGEVVTAAGEGEPRGRTFFAQGFLTNALNPKVAMFFLAFLPQFIDANAPSKAMALAALGLIFNVNGTIINLIVAAAAGRAGASPGFARTRVWIERAIGALFVGFGMRLVLAERP